MKKSVTKINKETLVQLLSNVEKGEFVNIETLTMVKMNKRNNPYYEKVFKKSSKNVRTLPDYEKRVQNKTENPNFESKPNWFEHISPCVVQNRKTEEKYLMYESFDKLTVKNEFTHENEVIEKEVFEPFLPTYKERDINVFTVKMDNIKKLSYKGVRYEIE